MKYLLSIIITFYLVNLLAIARPSVKYCYIAKLLHIIEPNYFYVEELYTHQPQKLVIAGTCEPLRDFNQIIISKYIDKPSDFVCIISYGYDKYGRIIGDIKQLDRIQQLSYELIASGTCKWYRPFDPCDGTMQQCEQWAKQHKLGVWKIGK